MKINITIDADPTKLITLVKKIEVKVLAGIKVLAKIILPLVIITGVLGTVNYVWQDYRSDLESAELQTAWDEQFQKEADDLTRGNNLTEWKSIEYYAY